MPVDISGLVKPKPPGVDVSQVVKPKVEEPTGSLLDALLGTKPKEPMTEEELFAETAPQLRIPRFDPAKAHDPRGKFGTTIMNLLLGGAQLTANLPGMLLEGAREARFGGDEPTTLDIISPEGEVQVPEIVKGLVRPAAKLAAGIKTKEETKAGRELFEESLEEAMTHPESIVLPFLIAAGARGGRGRVAKVAEAKIPSPVEPTKVARLKAKPKGEPLEPILREVLDFEKPTERVPIVEEVLGVEKAKPKLEVAKRDVRPASELDVAKMTKEERIDFYDKEVAERQRGKPESAMLRATDKTGGGVYSVVLEHVGDLTHRMSEKVTADRGGIVFVQEKVKRGLRFLENEYGFEREMRENFAANAKARGQSLSEFTRIADEAVAEYTQAHREMPAYNEVQRLARDAAIAVGEKNFNKAATNLHKLQKYLDEGVESWTKRTQAADLQPKPAPSPRSVKPKLEITKKEAKPPVAKTPEAVAREVNATFDGIQESPKRGDFYQFTDHFTKSFILVKDLSEVPAAIKRVRAGFEKAEPAPAPKAEPTKPIGLSKVEANNLRRNTGLDQLPEAERHTWDRTLAEAKEGKLDESAMTTAEEVINSKRPISDTEHAGMVLKAAKLADEYDASIKTVSNLIEEGKIDAAGVERMRSEVIIDQLDKLTEATRTGRREVARALSIGRMLVERETYDLAHVKQRARAAKGKRLTPEENTKIETLIKEHSELQNRVKQLEADFDKESAAREKMVAERIANRETQKGKITRKAAGTRERIVADRANIKKQIAELGIRVNDITGVTPEAAHLIGKLAVSYIKEGVVTLDAVVKKVLVDLPGLTERDVYKSLTTRDPKIQARARTDVTRRITALKRQAQLLLDIEKAEKGIFDVKPKRQPTLPEIRQLQKKLRDLRTQAYKSGLAASRLERSIRTINELQDQLANQYRNIRRRRDVDPPEIAEAKRKIKDLRNMMRTEDELARLNDQLRTGEFEVRKLQEPRKLTPELERKKVDLKIVRQKVRIAVNDLKPLTAGRALGETVNTARTLRATADMSATFRQLLMVTPRRPIKAAKAFGKAFMATFSEHKANRIDQAIRSVPHHYIREKSGLFLAELDGKLGVREELFQSNLAERIPGWGRVVKASNRHMTTALNLMRTMAFDEFLKKYPNATHGELKAWADFVNAATGRGDLGRFASAANVLSLGIFAPKFAVSRIQAPAKMFKYWKEPRVRKEISKDMVALAGLGGLALSLAKLGGADVEDDLREPDWGKIRVGNTRIDIWGGFQQPMRVVSRIGIGITDKLGFTGKHLTEAEKDIDPLELVGQFSAYKMSPLISIPLELYKGKTIVGEEVSPTETAVKAITPMVYEDMYDAWRLEGTGKALLSGGLNFLGVGTNTYEDSQSKTRRDVRALIADGDFGAASQKIMAWNIRHPEALIESVKPIEELEIDRQEREAKRDALKIPEKSILQLIGIEKE